MCISLFHVFFFMFKSTNDYIFMQFFCKLSVFFHLSRQSTSQQASKPVDQKDKIRSGKAHRFHVNSSCTVVGFFCFGFYQKLWWEKIQESIFMVMIHWIDCFDTYCISPFQSFFFLNLFLAFNSIRVYIRALLLFWFRCSTFAKNEWTTLNADKFLIQFFCVRFHWIRCRV